MRFLSLAVAFLLIAQPACAEKAAETKPEPLSILRITPQGEDVPASRQIVIEFNRAVVPLGKMDRTADELGITTTPALQCNWRWLNAASLSCNLDDKAALRPATSYTLTITPKIAAMDGAKLAETVTHSFITQRADVAYTSFTEWRGPTTPVIRVAFNQPVTKSSVDAHMYLASKDGSKRFAVQARPDPDDETPASVAENGEKARRVWLVEPPQMLPNNAEVTLKIEAGLVSAQGKEASAKGRDIVSFYTYPAFSFAGISCTNNDDKNILIPPGATDPDLRCDPMRPVSLAFTAPVLRSTIKDTLKTTPPLSGKKADYNPWGDENLDWSRRSSPHYKDNLYYIGLPVGLQAAQSYDFSMAESKVSFWHWLVNKWKGIKPAQLQDEFGRIIEQPVQITFATNHRKPNFEIIHHNAVLEKATDSEVPLYVNNLTKATLEYRTLTGKSVLANQRKDVPFAKAVQDIQFAVPFGIRDMLGGQSGAVYGRLSVTPEIKVWDGARLIFAQVTPYQVHAKLGHFQSVVWVTDLATGQPVEGAQTRIVTDKFTTLGSGAKNMARATTDKNGVATLPGLDTLDPQQELVNTWDDDKTRLFVRVEKDGDMALLPIASPYFVDTWRFYENNVSSYNADRNGHMKAWGLSAQGVYRVGDTIQYKIYLRGQDNQKLILPPKDGYYTLTITDPTGKVVDTKTGITFSKFGTYAGEYAVPDTASMGWYQFNITADFNPDARAVAMKKAEDDQLAADELNEEENDENEDGYDNGDESRKGAFKLAPMRVLVSDFTPAPFRVGTELNGDHFRPGDTLEIDSTARMHSGGAYTDASVRVTTTLESRAFTPDTPVAQGFRFDSFLGESNTQELMQETSALDDAGNHAEKLTLKDSNVVFGNLRVESAVQDDRGKSIAGSASADFVGVDRLVGLKTTDWVYPADKPAQILTLVVDDKGQPVAKQPINMTIAQDVVTTAKVKGAGNAYLSETTHDWVDVASCKLESAADMAVPCDFTPKGAGTYRATATIEDSKGRSHQTTVEFWVSGADYIQWDNKSDFVLPIVAEKPVYKVGDTARYLVKNPFPGAKALISVERYGVLDSWVQTLDGSSPIISIPVKADYLPGYYVSVVVISPRVEAPPAEEGSIDMGKPSFRMGYAGTRVEDDYKQLNVTVKPASDTYRPGDEVQATIHVAPKNAAAETEAVEVAVAVVDEAVFDLITDGRNAYDPYKGFYSLDALDMRNYTLMNALVGRQKFEKKGANPGGDGGVDLSMRTITKFVSYWNPALTPDADGNVSISFKSPDNLTGWRVLAMATTPQDRMGLGEGTFKVNRPTELRPVMPNQIRESDTATVGFSVMNRTDKPRDITVKIVAEGALDGARATHEETVSLAAYKRHTVTMQVKGAGLPEGSNGNIRFTATAEDALDGDALTHDVPVLPARVYDVGAIYGTTDQDEATLPLSLPDGRLPNSTSLRMTLAPTVIGNLNGAFRYMRDYPYMCWEQRLTKGVMAAQYQRLKPYLAQSVQWPGSDTLTVETLASAASFQAPNGGMAYFVASDDRVDPYLSAYTALAFGWLKQMGYAVPKDVAEKLDGYIDSFLAEDTAPDFYQAGMVSDVRAVMLHARALSGGDVSLERYREAAAQMSLFGKAHLLQAATLHKADTKLGDALKTQIMNHASQSAGKLSFNTHYDDGYSRILATPLRDNCAVLSAFVDTGLRDDKPMQMVRAITQSRGNRDHWENTQENIFCAQALIDYADAFEATSPQMVATVTQNDKTNDKTLAQATFAKVSDPMVSVVNTLPDTTPKDSVLKINRNGQGRLYYSAQLRYALKQMPEKLDAGIDIRREISVRQKDGYKLLDTNASIRQGDLVKIDLYLSVPTARNFVVVNDPLAGGLEAVNRDLATSSEVDADEGLYDEAGGAFWFKFGDWNEFDTSFWNFYHRELRHDSVRFYADYLPPGRYHLSYTAQAIAPGRFALLPTRAEEMYDADIYGLAANGTLTVTSSK